MTIIDGLFGDDHDDDTLRFLDNYTDDDTGLELRDNILLRVGRSDDKAPLDLRPFFSWDVSSIPSTATVSSAQLIMRSDNSVSQGSFPSTLECIDNSERALDDTIAGNWYTLTDTRTSIQASELFVAVRSVAITATDGLIFHTLESGVHESAIEITSNGNWNLTILQLRHGGSVFTGTVYLEIYTAAGTAGNYSADTLVATTGTVDLSTLTSSFVAKSFGNTAFAVTTGEIYMVRVIANFTSSAEDEWMELGKDDASGSATLNIRQQPNLNIMQGFNPWFYPGQGAWSIPSVASVAVPTPLVIFNPSRVYTFGDIGPFDTENTEVPGFGALMQGMLDTRISGQNRIGMYWDGLGAEDEEWRNIDGSNDPVHVQGDFHGVVLRIIYEDIPPEPPVDGCPEVDFESDPAVSLIAVACDVVGLVPDSSGSVTLQASADSSAELAGGSGPAVLLDIEVCDE